MSQCRQLLQNSSDLDAAGVRVGNVYALMVDSMIAVGNLRGTQQLMEEFRHAVGPGVNLAYYLTPSTLSRLTRELGIPLSSSGDKVRGPMRQDRVTEQDEPLDEEVEVVEEEEEVLEYRNGQAHAI